MSFKFKSSAIYLPKTTVTAEELDRQLGLKAGESRNKYGVDYRHYASLIETALYMGAKAVTRALTQAEMALADIDLLIYASGTIHQPLPYNAAGILTQLEASVSIPTLDINTSCLSFISALEMAYCALASRRYQRILIVTSELTHAGLDQNIPEIATLFADGAAAFILEASAKDSEWVTSSFHTYPEGYALSQIRSGGSALHPKYYSDAEVIKGSYFEMDGKRLFRLVSKVAKQFVSDGLATAKLSLSDMDYIVPHQASYSGLAHIMKKLNFSPEKTINLLPSMGNQVAASIPIALDYLLKTKNPKPGQNILLFGTAAGLTLGLGVIRL